MKSSTINKGKDILFYSIGIIIIIVIWSIISAIENNILYPSVLDILKDIFNLLTEWNSLKLIGLTIIKLILLIGISYIISVLLAIVAYKFEWVKKILLPIITIMRAIPVAAVVILLILFVSLKYAPLIITIFVIVPVAYESIYTTLKDIDRDVLDEVRMNSNINLKIIITLFFPMKKVNILSAVLQTCGLGLKVLVMSEILTQGINTIGGNIQLARSNIDITRVFAWTIILLALILIIELGLNLLRNRFEKN